jgi:hypothetical protein
MAKGGEVVSTFAALQEGGPSVKAGYREASRFHLNLNVLPLVMATGDKHTAPPRSRGAGNFRQQPTNTSLPGAQLMGMWKT